MLKMVMPLPKAKHYQIQNQKSKKSEIFSSTPYKYQVIAEQEDTKKQGGKRNVFGSPKTKPPKKNYHPKKHPNEHISSSDNAENAVTLRNVFSLPICFLCYYDTTH